MNKDDALEVAQAHLDYYGSGKYKDYEEITMPDGRPGIRVTGFVPTITDMSGLSREEIEQRNQKKTVSTEERDTHFAGFARLLWQDLEAIRSSGAFRDMTWDEQLVEEQKVIAQRAYDLVCHIEGLHVSEWSNIDDFVSSIPDITEWPEQNG